VHGQRRDRAPLGRGAPGDPGGLWAAQLQGASQCPGYRLRRTCGSCSCSPGIRGTHAGGTSSPVSSARRASDDSSSDSGGSAESRTRSATRGAPGERCEPELFSRLDGEEVSEPCEARGADGGHPGCADCRRRRRRRRRPGGSTCLPRDNAGAGDTRINSAATSRPRRRRNEDDAREFRHFIASSPAV
jgi:hypothetical protein